MLQWLSDNSNTLQLITNILLVIITGIYAYLTYRILDVNRKLFYETNRPIISIVEANPNISSEFKRAILTFMIQNKGKIPGKITNFKIILNGIKSKEKEETSVISPEQTIYHKITLPGNNYTAFVSNGLEITIEYVPEFAKTFTNIQKHKSYYKLRYQSENNKLVFVDSKMT